MRHAPAPTGPDRPPRRRPTAGPPPARRRPRRRAGPGSRHHLPRRPAAAGGRRRGGRGTDRHRGQPGRSRLRARERLPVLPPGRPWRPERRRRRPLRGRSARSGGARSLIPMGQARRGGRPLPDNYPGIGAIRRQPGVIRRRLALVELAGPGHRAAPRLGPRPDPPPLAPPLARRLGPRPRREIPGADPPGPVRRRYRRPTPRRLGDPLGRCAGQRQGPQRLRRDRRRGRPDRRAAERPRPRGAVPLPARGPKPGGALAGPGRHGLPLLERPSPRRHRGRRPGHRRRPLAGRPPRLQRALPVLASRHPGAAPRPGRRAHPAALPLPRAVRARSLRRSAAPARRGGRRRRGGRGGAPDRRPAPRRRHHRGAARRRAPAAPAQARAGLPDRRQRQELLAGLGRHHRGHVALLHADRERPVLEPLLPEGRPGPAGRGGGGGAGRRLQDRAGAAHPEPALARVPRDDRRHPRRRLRAADRRRGERAAPRSGHGEGTPRPRHLLRRRGQGGAAGRPAALARRAGGLGPHRHRAPARPRHRLRPGPRAEGAPLGQAAGDRRDRPRPAPSRRGATAPSRSAWAA